MDIKNNIMELFEITSVYRIVADALVHEGKAHCGDYFRYAEIDSGQLVILALSDGVGSFHHDWVASKTACDSFIESFANSDISDLTGRLKHAISKADQAVSDPVDPVAKGMMCTFIAVVWETKSNEVLFCNIGDSRLYHHAAIGLRQISVDEKKAVLMRDRGGKLLTQSGTLVVREGLTNALGYNNASINIEKQSFEFGDALVLSSDGMYNFPNFEEEIGKILQHCDLKAALNSFIQKNKGLFDDDASILLLQRTLLPDEIINQIRVGINENKTCSELNLPVHLITIWIMDEFRKLISQRDSSGLEKMTEYATKYELTLSESFIENSIDEMKKTGFFNALFYQMLIVQLKKLRW
jgi:serine/threonine protein phosphatase PrpC